VDRQEEAKLRGEAQRAVILEFELKSLMSVLDTWAKTFGAALVPSGADTYGEGIRDAKAQVASILSRHSPDWKEKRGAKSK
jgi:hypothetical protein